MAAEPYKLSTVQTGMAVGPVLSHTGNHTCSAVTFSLMTEFHSGTESEVVSTEVAGCFFFNLKCFEFFFLCTWVLCLYCVCILCECSADEGQRVLSTSLKLDLQRAVSHHVGTVNQSWVPCRNSVLNCWAIFLALFVAFIRAREDVMDLTTSPKTSPSMNLWNFGLFNIVTMIALSGPWLPGPGNSGHYHIWLTACSCKGFVGTQPGLFVCYSTTGVC